MNGAAITGATTIGFTASATTPTTTATAATIDTITTTRSPCRFFAKQVPVRAGSNDVTVELRGLPGRSLTVAIIGSSTGDDVKPTITPTVSPAANANGWNKSNVTVTFTCADTGSGIAACPDPVTVSTEGANQVVSGTATDKAGNTATASVTLNIDKTAPVLTSSVAPVANANGWNNSAVTVSFAATDVLSGIAPGSLTLPVMLAADGTNLSATGSATDRAGNAATTTRSGVNIDKVAPSITVAVAPPPDASGYNLTAVTAHFTCSDAHSGIDLCPPDRSISTEGSGQTTSGTTTDTAGNTASVTSGPFSIDLAPPTISVTLSPPANAAGFRTPPVVAHFTCADTGSGIASCPPDQSISTNGLNQTVSGTATDRAGRTASVTSEPFSISASTPTITASVSPAPNANGWNRTPVTVHFVCSDPVSGIASCPADQTVSTEGANQAISGTAVNDSGTSATASVQVSLDMTTPAVTLSPPTTSITGSNVFTPSVNLTGTATDGGSGVATVTCNGAVSTIDGAAYSCVASLTPGTNTIQATAVDRAGNSVTSAGLTLTYTRVPLITLLSPTHLSYTASRRRR